MYRSSDHKNYLQKKFFARREGRKYKHSCESGVKQKYYSVEKNVSRAMNATVLFSNHELILTERLIGLHVLENIGRQR